MKTVLKIFVVMILAVTITPTPSAYAGRAARFAGRAAERRSAAVLERNAQRATAAEEARVAEGATENIGSVQEQGGRTGVSVYPAVRNTAVKASHSNDDSDSNSDDHTIWWVIGGGIVAVLAFKGLKSFWEDL